MNKITTFEAAKILGVTKKTIIRWEESGLLPKVTRKGSLKSRYYDKEIIEEIAKWRNLRKEEKAHLRKLDAIRAKLDKYLPLKPLNAFEQPRTLNPEEFEEMRQGYKDLEKWRKQLDKIQKKYGRLAKNYFGKGFDE